MSLLEPSDCKLTELFRSSAPLLRTDRTGPNPIPTLPSMDQGLGGPASPKKPWSAPSRNESNATRNSVVGTPSSGLRRQGRSQSLSSLTSPAKTTQKLSDVSFLAFDREDQSSPSSRRNFIRRSDASSPTSNREDKSSQTLRRNSSSMSLHRATRTAILVAKTSSSLGLRVPPSQLFPRRQSPVYAEFDTAKPSPRQVFFRPTLTQDEDASVRKCKSASDALLGDPSSITLGPVVPRRRSDPARSQPGMFSNPNLKDIKAMDLDSSKLSLQSQRSAHHAHHRASKDSMTPEFVASPAYAWYKNLKHFTGDLWHQRSEQLQLPSRQKTIPIEDAIKISSVWNDEHHNCAVAEPSPTMIERALKQINGGNKAVESMNFEQLMQFVQICELSVLMEDEWAGWHTDEIEKFSIVFKQHSLVGEITESGYKGTLDWEDIFDLLKGSGRSCLSYEENQEVLAMERWVNRNSSEQIDFQAFLKIMKMVHLRDSAIARQREQSLIEACCLSESQIIDYREVFLFFRNVDGGFHVNQFNELFQDFREFTRDEEHELRCRVRSITATRQKLYADASDVASTLSFGEFLCVLEKLIVDDFAGIKSQIDLESMSRRFSTVIGG